MALDYELQSRKLLILFTSVRRWYLSKAMMSVWGHQFFHKYPFNTLICKQLLLTDDVVTILFYSLPYTSVPMYAPPHSFALLMIQTSHLIGQLVQY